MTSSFFSIASIRLLSPGCVSQLKRLIRYAACGGSLGVRGSCFFFPRLSRGGLTSCRSAPHLSCRTLGPNPAVGEPGRSSVRFVSSPPPDSTPRSGSGRCHPDPPSGPPRPPTRAPASSGLAPMPRYQTLDPPDADSDQVVERDSETSHYESFGRAAAA